MKTRNKKRFDKLTIFACAATVYTRKGDETCLHDVIRAVATATQKDYFDVHDKVKTVLSEAGWIIESRN